ncbi:MAG: CPBP family intramembrane metalloprotease [Candidatus Eisenbacteria bacterium]|nr:CPBP family intramembrane metalloprotease [Candidatus Eisenbacteria bacterium]
MNQQPSGPATPPRTRFAFANHPWLSLVTFLFLSVLVLGVMGTVFSRGFGMPPGSRVTGFVNSLASHIILLFVITPFVLRLPKGRRSFREYLGDIGLTRVEPMGQLLVLALSCYVILALSQTAGSVVYRLTQGLPVTWGFLGSVFDLSHDLPPQSLSTVFSLPSAFEEVGSRGVILTLFLARYSKRRSVLIAAGGFAVLHLLNLLGGREPVWVLGQLGWSFAMGIFYGYLFVKTRSLWPVMLIHYLANAFIGSLAGYMQSQAPVTTQVLYGLTFSLGVIPVTLMMLWVKFYTKRNDLSAPYNERGTE